MSSIMSLFVSPEALAFYAAVALFAAGHLNGKYAAVASALTWFAGWLKGKTLPLLLVAAVALLFVAGLAHAAPPAKKSFDKCDCCKPTCTCAPGKKNPDCVCYPCDCGGVKGKAGERFVEPADTHVSPDGTVNRKCADGIYRAVPGAAKQKPSCPSGPTCPGGFCPAPALRPFAGPACPTCPGSR